MSSRIVYSHQESKTKSWRRLLGAVLFPAALLLLGAGAIASFRLPYLQIREITISGLESFETRAVEERIGSLLDGTYFFLLPRRSYFLADTRALAEDLGREFPQMREIRAAKRFPDELQVAVTERSFWGISCNTSGDALPLQCVYIDPTGFAYEEAPQVTGALILAVERDGEPPAVGQTVIESAMMERLRLLKEGFGEAGDVMITGFELRKRIPTEIRARTSDGFMLVLSRDDDFARMFGVLKRVLDEEIKEKRERLEYIDLRFGNKVFYKWK